MESENFQTGTQPNTFPSLRQMHCPTLFEVRIVKGAGREIRFFQTGVGGLE